MTEPVGVRVWLPFVATVALLFVVSFGVAALATDTWADLAGLGYLLVAPFLYRRLRSKTAPAPDADAGPADAVAGA